MAHHPSPSTSRRLSELLGEQQEPFYLDFYLLEKGCSPAFLDAAACGGACSTCWPTRARRSTGGRLLRRPAARSNKVCHRGSGVLRLLLSKLLSGSTATAKRQQPAAAIDWRHAHADADEKQSSPGRSANAAVVPASPSAAVECGHRTEVHEERKEDDDDDEDGESSKKQLSPVSVLEQRLFERSPPPPHAQKAFVLFSELIEAAYAPTSRSSDGGSTPATRRWSRNSKDNHARARKEEEEDMLCERDLATATALVASELGGARVWAEDVGPEREDVAGDVTAAMLEALTEEAAAELMEGMMGQQDHGWCALTRRRR